MADRIGEDGCQIRAQQQQPTARSNANEYMYQQTSQSTPSPSNPHRRRRGGGAQRGGEKDRLMATTARNRHHSPLRVSGQLDSPLPGHLRLYSGRAFLHPRPQVIGSPNNDAGVDRMVNVIAHEIAELLPGQDPSSLTGIADMYREIYGTGGGSSYTGQLSVDKTGVTYNKNRARRRFLA